MSALRDDRAKFEAAETVVFGVNPMSLESHQDFVKVANLNFPLIVDNDRAVARAFGADNGEGEKITRTVVVIDKNGVVSFLERGIPTNEDLLTHINKA